MSIELKNEILKMTGLSQEEAKSISKKRTFGTEVYESTELNVENIIPELISVSSTHKLWNEWTSISEHVSSFTFRRSPGRNMYFLVKNKFDNKNLGIIDVAADFLSLGNRDKYIGWDLKTRLVNNKNIANISVCVPTRLFGYNLSGGKLLALLAISNTVREQWKNLYGDDLLGLTVTSLYGRGSQYNRLKYFTYLGKTKGFGTTQIPDGIYKKMRDYVESVDGEIPGGRFTKGKNSKINIINRCCNLLEINPADLTNHGNKRGIYWSDLAKNTKQVLKNEADVIEYFDLNIDDLTQYWRDVWAKRRLENLIKRNDILTKQEFF